MPAGKHAQGGLGESLDPHDSGQHRRAVDPVIVQEWLDFGIESGLHGQATVNTHSGDLAHHRSLPQLFGGSGEHLRVKSTGGIPFIQKNAQTLADDNFTACSA